ncbi:MAG: ribosome recycling factor [Deltaproteobacteria bacterium]|nr:ribosome recycling factor [Deltaproteobacteria bacterium]
MEEVIRELRSHMDRSVEAFKRDLGQIRTGRASISLLDGVRVDYYGNPTPLNQLATLSVPEPRSILIQPWDPSVGELIAKAILTSDLGLNPTHDGKIIRIAIPSLTEERRKELVKRVHKIAEESRVALRNIRRDLLERLKKREKEESLSEDVVHQTQDRVQKVTDEEMGKIEKIVAAKEKEILEV